MNMASFAMKGLPGNPFSGAGDKAKEMQKNAQVKENLKQQEKREKERKANKKQPQSMQIGAAVKIQRWYRRNSVTTSASASAENENQKKSGGGLLDKVNHFYERNVTHTAKPTLLELTKDKDKDKEKERKSKKGSEEQSKLSGRIMASTKEPATKPENEEEEEDDEVMTPEDENELRKMMMESASKNASVLSGIVKGIARIDDSADKTENTATKKPEDSKKT